MKYSILTFVLLAIAQLFVPAQMIFKNQTIENQGVALKFKCAPIDPAHPFRGRYVDLNFEENTFGSDKNFESEYIYITFQNDHEGYAHVSDVSDVPFPEDIYFKLKNEKWDLPALPDSFSMNNPATDSVVYWLNYPFSTYYMEEYKAPIAERLYAELLRDSATTTYALVSIYRGEAVLKDVQVNGRSLSELAAEQLK